MPEKKNQYCIRCGASLTSVSSGWRGTEYWMGGEYYPFCVKCQQKYFATMSMRMPRPAALFFCCAAFDVPFSIRAVDEMSEFHHGIWVSYLRKMRALGLNRSEDGKTLGFMDGETDFQKALKQEPAQWLNAIPIEDMSELDWRDDERWAAMWGDGYSLGEYKELDRIYEGYAEDISGGVELPIRTKRAVIDVCKWTLERDRIMRHPDKDNVNIAKNLQSMIDGLLKGEALQKTDKPMDDYFIDKITACLERHGFLRDGKLLTYEETVEALWRVIKGEEPKYPYSVDVADQSLVLIRNSTLGNENIGAVSELPPEYVIDDKWGEFEPKETESEKQIKAELGLLNLHRSGKKQDETKKQ